MSGFENLQVVPKGRFGREAAQDKWFPHTQMCRRWRVALIKAHATSGLIKSRRAYDWPAGVVAQRSRKPVPQHPVAIACAAQEQPIGIEICHLARHVPKGAR